MGYKHTTEQPTPPRQINSRIPVHVEQAILKALAKQRNDRHRDVAAFLSALRTPPSPQTTKEEWLNKESVLHNRKRYEEALEILRLNPNNAYAYYNMGIALHDLNRYEEALSAYEQAIRLDPNYTDAYYGKGLTLDCLGQSVKAQQAYKKARELDSA